MVSKKHQWNFEQFWKRLTKGAFEIYWPLVKISPFLIKQQYECYLKVRNNLPLLIGKWLTCAKKYLCIYLSSFLKDVNQLLVHCSKWTRVFLTSSQKGQNIVLIPKIYMWFIKDIDPIVQLYNSRNCWSMQEMKRSWQIMNFPFMLFNGFLFW